MFLVELFGELSTLICPSSAFSGAGAVGAVGVIDTVVAMECLLRCVVVTLRVTDMVSSWAFDGKLVIWNSAGGGSFPNSCERETGAPVSIFGSQTTHEHHRSKMNTPAPSSVRAAR